MPLPSQPSEIDVQLQHADSFVAVGNIAAALGMYRTAALLAEQRGDTARALAIHARIGRVDPDPGARARIGELQLQLGERAAAARTLDGVVRDELRYQRWAQALHAASVAVTAEPTAVRRRVVADLATRLGQLDLAVVQLHALAVEALEAGAVPRAQALCQRALALRPGHLPSLRSAVDAHLRARDVHRAVAAIRGILAQLPQDAGALEGMAEAFAMLGNRASAAEVLRLLAVRLQAAAAFDDARALVHRALAWQPDSEALRGLDRQLCDRPSPVAREIVADPTRVIDLADLLEMTPPKRAAVPLRRADAPPPTRRTRPYVSNTAGAGPARR